MELPHADTLYLTDSERHSPLWRKLSAHWETRLIVLREQNDAVMPEDSRNYLIGRIAQLKETMAIGHVEPVLDPVLSPFASAS